MEKPQDQKMQSDIGKTLSDILGSSVSLIDEKAYLDKRKSSSSNIQLSATLQSLEEQLQRSNLKGKQVGIQLEEALANSQKLLKSNKVLEQRAGLLQNEKVLAIAMIASSNNRAVQRELSAAEAQQRLVDIEQENLRLKKMIISKTKEIDLLESLAKSRDQEVQSFKQLHDKNIELLFKPNHDDSVSNDQED